MIILGLAVLGAIFGSFVHALVWRLHEQSILAIAPAAQVKGRRRHKKQVDSVVSSMRDLSIVKGRSMCPKCRHVLTAKDLVPIVSWLWLRGKCRYCGAGIPDNPLVELLMGGLFVASYVMWPQGFYGVGLFQFVLWLAFLVAFVALALYDIRWFLLPDRIVFPLVALAAVQVTVAAAWQHNWAALWQPVAGAAVMFGLFWVLYQVSKGAWIGGGDVKLALVLGLLAATPFRALTIIFLASLIGTLVSAPLLVRNGRNLKLRIPFGPPLLLATVIVVLYGAHIAGWYQGLVLG